jgi:methyltransferase (TIGR00027 family)
VETGPARRGASRTAFIVAALRAAHQLLDNEPRVLDDAVAVRLLGPTAIDGIRGRLDQVQSPAARALRSHVVLRSRYAEDRLAEAVRRGVRQYVILGAGLDTFAYRQPDWAAQLRIFEVDQPASQAAKRAALAAAGLDIPANVTFVSIDFETESLRDALQSAGFDAGAPAFISWLGVMVYLAEAAADEVFRFVAALPAQTEIVFTFAPRVSDRPDDDAASAPSAGARAEALGEPWRTFVDPEQLLDKLRRFGFSTVSLLTPAEADERYFRGREDGLPPPRHATIGSAIV